MGVKQEGNLIPDDAWNKYLGHFGAAEGKKGGRTVTIIPCSLCRWQLQGKSCSWNAVLWVCAAAKGSKNLWLSVGFQVLINPWLQTTLPFCKIRFSYPEHYAAAFSVCILCYGILFSTTINWELHKERSARLSAQQAIGGVAFTPSFTSVSTRISSHWKLSALSIFWEGFFSIFNEEAFQEFQSISSDQGTSLYFSLRRGSCPSVICCWAFFPWKVFLAHQKKRPTPHHFTLPAVLGIKSQSSLGMDKNVKWLQRMIVNFCMEQLNF